MPRHDRSRSPLRWCGTAPAGERSSEWISRQLVQFGRYAHKRPPALRVDNSGAFVLSELMSVWGRQQGLTEQDVISAVQQHMFNEGKLRFVMDMTPAQELCIRVPPKEWAGAPPQSAWSRAGENRGGRERDARRPAVRPASGSRPSLPTIPKGAGPFSFWHDADTPADTHAIPATRPPPAEAFSVRSSQRGKGSSRGRRDGAKQHRADDKRRGGKGGGAQYWDSGAAGTPEQAQRWLAWVLQGGHAKLGIEMKGSWASAEKLADAMAEDKPQLGVRSAAGLMKLLAGHFDKEGRFEIRPDGFIRKVPRDERSATGGGESIYASERASPSRSHAVEVTAGAADAWHTPEKIREGRRAEVSDGQEYWTPPKPPKVSVSKEHWTEYLDDSEDNGCAWWHYKGPLGEYWAKSENAEPQIYHNDGEEDDVDDQV